MCIRDSIVTDIERIGDHAENIADLTIQKINKKLQYSEDAINEIANMYQTTIKALDCLLYTSLSFLGLLLRNQLSLIQMKT